MPAPTNSMWGQVDSCRETIPDIAYSVGTPSHGGIMVEETWAKANLSAAALERTTYNAVRFGGWICYEEDCAWAIPLYDSEVLRKAWISTYTGDRITEAEILAEATESLERWNKHYLTAVKAERGE